MRAVLDTQVFVRALINPKSKSGLLLSRYANRFTMVVSTDVVQEILEVLFRSSLKGKYKRLEKMDLAKVIALLSEAVVVEPKENVRICRDPDDDKFLDCGIAGEADFIVSEDQDLLAIREYRGIQIVTTGTFLDVVRGEKPQSS